MFAFSVFREKQIWSRPCVTGNSDCGQMFTVFVLMFSEYVNIWASPCFKNTEMFHDSSLCVRLNEKTKVRDENVLFVNITTNRDVAYEPWFVLWFQKSCDVVENINKNCDCQITWTHILFITKHRKHQVFNLRRFTVY